MIESADLGTIEQQTRAFLKHIGYTDADKTDIGYLAYGLLNAVNLIAGSPAFLAQPETGELGEEELIRCLQIRAAQLGAKGANLSQRGDAFYFSHAAELLQRQAAPAPVAIPDELRQIGHRLRTQDNRCTADPIFQVRGLRRIYGMDTAHADTTVWIDTEGEPIEVEPPADPEKPGDFVINTAYQDHWEVIMTAFSEQACLDYIERNGHRHNSYQKLDIYADSLYRCPEMITIRNWLMALPLPQAGEVEP
jgi:hypothetical protein